MKCRMRFLSAGVCGTLCLGSRKRCCTTCRGIVKAAESIDYWLGRRSRPFVSNPCGMGVIILVVGLVVETCFQCPRFRLSLGQNRGVGVEVMEPVALGETIHPMCFRHLFARQPLAETRLHRPKLGQG